MLAIALVVTACDSDIVGPGDLRLLGEAHARWNARSFADYTYEIQTLCFCPPEITQWTRVTVRDGAVANAEPVEPDPNFPITGSYWQPIDSLFVDIHRRITEQASYLDAVIANYDAQLGYPTRIEYRYKANILDAGAIINVRNVVPLN
jgi:uncharacterized protein DUF6174